MTFDLSTTSLANKPQWQHAADICHAWLTQNMSMFGPDRILSFMKNQPVAAAERIMAHCDDVSEETVTVLLLGPAKGLLIENRADERQARAIFGDRAVDLILTLENPVNAIDAQMSRDAVRISLAEGLSTMNDQLIGRARIDAHHQTRWRILQGLEAFHAQVNGQNPALDVVFADGLKRSRAALEALDNAPKAPRSPRPPSF